ncbi:MAG: hypothetical protein ABIU06_04500, partial [Anaerolineales bacterium]
MVNKSQIKISLLRVLIITGLILTALFPGSAQALTQDLSTGANQPDRGGASAGVLKIGQMVGRLAPFAGILPSGTPFLPSLLVNTIDTSTWSSPSTDPAGIAYWPLTGQLLISDTEIEESPQPFWDGFNIFQSTLGGSLSSNCTTFTSLPTNPASYNNFSDEPSGVAINASNNHVFFSDDVVKKIFEVAPGLDGNYCSSDDIVTSAIVSGSPYNIFDPEDIAYGQNKLFIASGADGEVYQFDLGANGVLGGGDDGSVTHFDTVALGFSDLEGLAYNAVNGTLFLISTMNGDVYLGETSTSGTLLRAYDLSYLGFVRRSGLTVAPASGDPFTNNIYIVSRGVDNFVDPDNNDGKVWEIDITNPDMPDLIFKDGFESGDLLAWTFSSTNAGNLSASPAAAMVGTYGMSAAITSTTGMEVNDDRPTLEPRYRARFYFDPNSIGMADGDLHNIFQGYSYSPYTDLYAIDFRVDFRYSGGAYQVRGSILNDSGAATNTIWKTITDASHFIEVDWAASTAAGANNGYLTFWVDGVQEDNKTGIDNDTRHIDRVKLGPSGLDAGTSGTYYFDAFESRRQSYIGEGVAPTVVSVARVNVSPTGASTVDFSVAFSEAVTGVDVTDFTLTTTGTVSGATVSGISGSGTSYTVTVNTGTGDGTIRLDVLDNNSIIDAYNNPLDGGFTNGQTYTVIKSSPFANVQVSVAGSSQANYSVAPKYNVKASYSALNNGPVKVESTNGVPIVASERVAYSPDGGMTWTSHAELMGLPANQVHTSYTFPFYNNVDLNSQLRFGNVGTVNTLVTVTVGGVVKGSYNLAPNASQRVSYAGLNAGPVKVTSNGQPIIASLRVAYFDGSDWTSFSEMMGLPSNRLTSSYTFPFYNNVDLNSQLRFGNVGTSPTTVTVTVGGVVKGTYPLAPNASQRVSYAGLNAGPVKITSSGNVPIIASLRVAYFDGSAWTDFSE